jgi:hypothetical protein
LSLNRVKTTCRLIAFAIVIILLAITPTRAEQIQTTSTQRWMTDEEITGIFKTGVLRYTITNGIQLPSIPRIHIYSNRDKALNLSCLADFRLVKISDAENITVDYFSERLASISNTSGIFWASTIAEPNATYRFGVVLWNTTTDENIGSLISTINCVPREPIRVWATLSLDKQIYAPNDTVHLTLGYHLNQPKEVAVWMTPKSITTGEPYSIEYPLFGVWVPVEDNRGWIMIAYDIGFNSSKTWNIDLFRFQLPNGRYRLVKDDFAVEFTVAGSSYSRDGSSLHFLGIFIFYASLIGLVSLAIYWRLIRKKSLN